MQVGIESYNYELQLFLAAEGRGLTLMPERVFLRSSLKSRLRVLHIAGLHFPFKIWSLQRTSAELEPVFSRLNHLLVMQLQKRPGSRQSRVRTPRVITSSVKSAVQAQGNDRKEFGRGVY